MQTPVQRMGQSLEGLSVGDAFGECFFGHPRIAAELWLQGSVHPGTLNFRDEREIGIPPWRWTDDTAMALSIVKILEQFGTIDVDLLARSFSSIYSDDPRRGYGPAMHTLLPQLRYAKTRTQAAQNLFGHQGSFGNGAAMRVAPLGAFFADDLDKVIAQARLSAEITHSHPEGIAGAIAIALAAALAWLGRNEPPQPPHEFLDRILPMVPTSLVANGIRFARDMAARADSLSTVINAVGNGSKVSAQDTVPFVLWSAATHLGNYEEALWHTVSALGDMDTNCAMVGGIVVMRTGVENIPADWRTNRESLPGWVEERGLLGTTNQ